MDWSDYDEVEEASHWVGYDDDYDDVYAEEQVPQTSSGSGDISGCFPAGLVVLAILVAGLLLFGLRVDVRTIRVSWYNPALLGTNCATVVGGRCVSTTASGMPWQQGMDWSAACAPKYPFGTVFFAGSLRPWVCKDRGGAIKDRGGYVWVDMLVERPVYPYGTYVPGAFFYFVRPIWQGN